ncbi:hypothetical protein JCM6882_008645 [Rhodosporidiobolus microsporus]
MSDLEQAQEDVSATASRVDAESTEAAGAAPPLDRIPDEVLSLILEQVCLAPVAAKLRLPRSKTPLSHLIVNKRIFAAARPIWLADVHYQEDDVRQENQLVNRLTRPDARPLVRRVEYRLASTARYDLGIISQFFNLVSLKIGLFAFDSGTVLPAAVTSSLHLLLSLRTLAIEADGVEFNLEDTTFNLSEALPNLHRVEVVSPPCAGARMLCAHLPQVRSLALAFDRAFYPTIPWQSLEYLELLASGPFGQLPRRLPLRTVSFPDSNLFPPTDTPNYNSTDPAKLLQLFDRVGVTDLRVHAESFVEGDWQSAPTGLRGLKTLMVITGCLSRADDWRAFANVLCQFPSLERLELFHAEFFGVDDPDFKSYAPPGSREFLTLFPQLATLITLIRDWMPILHISWHTPTTRAKYQWNRASKSASFEEETWIRRIWKEPAHERAAV